MDREQMKTELVSINPIHPEAPVILRAAKILKEGGIVAFPTETVYGLGANGLDPGAAGKIFAAKGRPADNPLILHIGDRSMLTDLVEEIPEKAYRLMDTFWPGPLTIVLKKNSSVPNIVPNIVTSGLSTVGIRMPSSPVFLALSKECRFPIAAPSANSFGKPSPTTAEDVLEDMIGKIPLILSAGKCRFGIESTIVSFAGPRPKLLRPGGVSLEEIEKLIGPVELHPAILNPESPVETAESPGMKYRHYSPETEIILAHSAAAASSFLTSSEASGKKMMLISSAPAAGHEDITQAVDDYTRWIVLEKPEHFAKNIYSLFREADREKFDIILVVSIPEKGIGLGVMNRLKKAAARRI